MFDDIPSVLPIHFFDLTYEANYLQSRMGKLKLKKEYLLPSTSLYLDEEDSNEIYFAWNENGLFFQVKVPAEDIDISALEYRRGDSIELFIDTRNNKSIGYITKFSHHFVIYPKLVDRSYIKEVTRFKNDDMHKLADPKDFEISVDIEKKYYFIDLFIPSKCLYGFDPSRFNKLGFTYMINRRGKEPCHLSLSSREISIERNPYFWTNILLLK